MKIEGSHLSKLLSRLSRFSNMQNTDGFDKIKGFNKRFSKHFADSNYVGLYQYNKGSFMEAITAYENVKYMDLNHEEQAVYSLNLGNCYFKLKEYQRAIDIYSFHSEEIEPEKQKAQRMNNLGSCYAKLKKY